ncbi:MAG: hypothetical protein J6M62_10410 [Selenomonadaceae bacterium]|nr:hypothetical protein [Selenomonadaceae bacterium]
MRDLFETELGMEKVEAVNAPRDLLADEPMPTYHGQIEKYATDDKGFTEDEQQLIGALFSPEELEEIEKMPPIGFLESLKGKGWSHILPYKGTGEDIVEAGVDLNMINKAKKGDAAAAVYVRNMLKEDYTKQLRGTTLGGKMGNILHYTPSFMGEMLVAAYTCGGGAAPKVAQTAGTQAVKTGVKEFAKSMVKRSGAFAAKSATIAAKMPQQGVKNYLDRRVAGSIELTDKGEAMLQNMDEMPATTAIKAFGDSWVAVASEMSGDALMAGAGKVLSPVGKYTGKILSPAMSRMSGAMPTKLKDAVLRTVKKYKPDASISKMLSDKVYFNGVVGEIAEERWEGVLRTVTGLDDREMSTTDKLMDAVFPDKDELLAEIGVFGGMGISSHAAVRAYNGLINKGFSPDQAKASLQNMTETQKEQLSEKIGITEGTSPKTVEVDLDKISLSPDIPNFKEGANENGVVEGQQLQGKYEKTGVAPIVLWERNNGNLEVITGRHRLDLARRTGEKSIPAQIVKESEGWDVERAQMFDVEQNIRDEKGTVRDFARFFKHHEITETEATENGFLARATGRKAFDIAINGTEALYTGFVNNKITEDKAAAIASGAPLNEAAQAAGIKAAKKMSADELKAYVSLLAQSKPSAEATADMFGFNDSAIKEAEAIAKLVAKDKKEINDKIRAVKGAQHNPEAAEKMGLRFKVTPENIGKEIKRLEFQIQQLDSFFTNPSLMGYYRGILQGKNPDMPQLVAAKKNGGADVQEKTSVQDFLLPYTPENVELVELASRIPQDMQELAQAAGKFAHPFLDREISKMDEFKRRWLDYLEPLRAFGESIYKDARLFAGVGGKIAIALTDHTENLQGRRTGEGLLPIVQDFKKEFGIWRQATVEADLGGYLVARRYIEDLSKAEGVKVTEEQLQASFEIMDELKAKYENNFMRLEHYAERIYEFQQRISHLLVESGLMSKKAYDAMLQAHPHYIPFKRILDENRIKSPEVVMKNAKGRGLLKARPVVKKIKGSDLDIRNPFASIVNNTADIIVNAHKNDIVRRVAKMRKAHPELVKEKEPDRASFDRGLRDMLKAGIKKLGGTYERTSKRLTVDNAFGVYMPYENKIKEKIGVDAALAHEFGHMLDFRLGLGKAILQSDEITKELEALADERLRSDLVEKNGRFERITQYPNDVKYMEYLYSPRELIANLYDSYINAPELLKEHAPQAKALLERFIQNSPHKWLQDIHRTLDVGFETMYGELDRAENIVPYYVNGRKKYIEVHKDLYDALKGVDSVKLPAVIDLFTRYPAALLRWGATQANITFALIRNPLRDTYTAAMQTNVGFIPVVSTLKGAGHKLLNTETYKEWKAAGGSFDSFMQLNENSKINPYKELFGHLNMFHLVNPFYWIEKTGALFEEGTRVGVYEKARNKGYSQKEAAYISRDSTIDFARGGSVAKQVNQFIPFFNANIQGLVSMTEKFKKRPISMTVKALAELTIPSIALAYYYTMAASDDDKKWYSELPAWRRNLFWNFRINGNDITLPKPFAYGAVFATLPQAMTEGITTGEDIDWTAQAKNIFDNINFIGDISSAMPPALKIALELQANTNFYTGRDIVPTYLVNVDPEEQYTDNTSETAKAISQAASKAGLHLSPMEIDHIVTSAGAGMVKDMLSMVDMSARDNAPEKETGDLPIIRGVIGKEPIGYNSKSVQSFMDKFDELSQTYNTYKKIEREDPERADGYAEKHEREIDLYEDLKGFNKQIKDISKEINTISQDEDLSPKEKKAQIRELKQEMTTLAQEAMEAINEH